MTDCARGCLAYGRHVPRCIHTNECPDDCPTHCDGCEPKPADVGNYCQKCADKLRAALTEIPGLTFYLEALPQGRLVTKKADGDHTRHATRVDQISPSPAFDELDEVWSWAYGWAVSLADDLHHVGPMRYRLDGIPDTSLAYTHVKYLLGNFTAVLSADWHEPFYEETLALRWRLERITGQDKLNHKIKAPCPSCDRRTLGREDGAAKVVCRNPDCSRVWTEDEYARLAVVAS